MNKDIKRVFLIVLDSFGVGNAIDAKDFGDEGANTIKTISKSNKFSIPNMMSLGIDKIDEVKLYKNTNVNGKDSHKIIGSYGRMFEKSKGKDTTIGHWEIAGHIEDNPLPVFKNGFPKEIIDEFKKKTNRGVLCNKPYSGTEVIKDYGLEHMKTGDLIVYTSADSVFQIAAHEDIVPIEELYRYCEIARKILVGKYGVGRVIARPFIGSEGNFTRTANRHDFSLLPPEDTMLDLLSQNGYDTYSIGKIYDIFAKQGIKHFERTISNKDGMDKTMKMLDVDFNGLCFVNLVDFDMLYGHRRDIDGYANAISEFDIFLGSFIKKMKQEDVLIITADHGCDPGYKGTDHTREAIPVLIYGKTIKSNVNIGTGDTYAHISATILDMFCIKNTLNGHSFFDIIGENIDYSYLMECALKAENKAYSPYSNFKVGAALLTKDNTIFTGCNIENTSFGATNCGERTAFYKAISEGHREFKAIAIRGIDAGGKNIEERPCMPCGICRQVMSEFCDTDFKIIVFDKDNDYVVYTLGQLMSNVFKL